MKIREEFLEYVEGKRDLDALHKACAVDPELAKEWEEYQKIVKIEAEVSTAQESLPDAFVQRVWGTILKHERQSWLERALEWYRQHKRVLIAFGGTCIAGLFCFVITEDMWKEVERMPVGGVNRFPPAVVGNTDVLVPLKDLKAGEELDPSYFAVESRQLPNPSSNLVNNLTKITGKYAASDIAAGQPLLSESVTERRVSSYIMKDVPEGYTMVTIPADPTTSGIEGWARPGTPVDVVWVGRQNGEPVAKIVVEGAQIISSRGSDAGREGSGHQNSGGQGQLSLRVPKGDALKIQLASQSGRLSVSLRSYKDMDSSAEKASIGMGDVIKSSEDKGRCRDARKRGIIDQIRPDGKVEKMVLDNHGTLVPLSKFCSSEVKELITPQTQGSSKSSAESDRCSKAKRIARQVLQADGSGLEMYPDKDGTLIPLSRVCPPQDTGREGAN